MASIYSENVKFICGRPFDSEYGHHDPGEEVTQAPQFQLLETLVHAGLLYPYAPDEGYDFLPPHLFSILNTRQEVEQQMEGDPAANTLGQSQWGVHGKPEVVKQAESQVKAAEDHRAATMKAAEEHTAKKAAAAQNPPARKSVADTVAKKTAAKKTAAKKTAEPKKESKS